MSRTPIALFIYTVYMYTLIQITHLLECQEDQKVENS